MISLTWGPWYQYFAVFAFHECVALLRIYIIKTIAHGSGDFQSFFILGEIFQYLKTSSNEINN